jgi:hypothetical protein
MRSGTIFLIVMIALTAVFPYCRAQYQQFEASTTTSLQLRVNGYMNLKLPWYQNETVSSGPSVGQDEATTSVNHEPMITALPDPLFKVELSYHEEGKKANVTPVQDVNDSKICLLKDHNEFEAVCEVGLDPDEDGVGVDGTTPELNESESLPNDHLSDDEKELDVTITLPDDESLVDHGNHEEVVDDNVPSHNDKYDNSDDENESDDFYNTSHDEREDSPPPAPTPDIKTRFLEDYDEEGLFLRKYSDHELIELLHVLRDMRNDDEDNDNEDEDAEIERYTRKLFPDPNYDPLQHLEPRHRHDYKDGEEDLHDELSSKTPPLRLSQADPRLFIGMCSDFHFRGVCFHQHPIEGACYSVRKVMPELDEQYVSSFA